MKIRIRDENHDFAFSIPTRLIFSRFLLRAALKCKPAADSLGSIPPEAAEKLLEELARVRKQYGPWELVSILSADGDLVTITL